MSEKKQTTIQPNDLFKILNIEKSKENYNLLSAVLSIFLYLRTGDKLVTSFVEFEKLSEDVFYIKHKVNTDTAEEFLEHKGIIRLPI